MSTPSLELSMARLEGAYEQINGRLGSIESRITSVEGRIAAVERKLDRQFLWMLSLLIVSIVLPAVSRLAGH